MLKHADPEFGWGALLKETLNEDDELAKTMTREDIRS